MISLVRASVPSIQHAVQGVSMSQPNTTVVAAKRRERGLSVIEQRRRDEEAELLRATVKRKVAAKNGKRVKAESLCKLQAGRL